MAGEMTKDEVTEENYPDHFRIAKFLGGSVEPFDQYQGPYIQSPKLGRLWLEYRPEWRGFIVGEGPVFFLDKESALAEGKQALGTIPLPPEELVAPCNDLLAYYVVNNYATTIASGSTMTDLMYSLEAAL